jgi:hypothetical protein
MIGHMNNDGRLGLSRLKGVVGDKINAILVGAGHNLRLILNHIRKMMKKNPLWHCRKPTPQIPFKIYHFSELFSCY